MATPDTDFDAQDTAEVFDETHSTDENDAPDETRSFAPDLFDDVYDATRADGDDDDEDALDAADYDPDDIDDEEDEDEDSPALYLDDDEDDEDDDDEDGLEFTDALDDAGRTDNRHARRFESSHELSDEQVEALGYRDRREDPAPGEVRGSGACADDVEDESHPRQEQLLDEGIEETFPASDPVSVKHIT